MKNLWKYFVTGCAVAVAGMFFSDLCGSFFNGMDYGSACNLGMGMFLCVVVVTCTGIISGRTSEQSSDSSERKED